METDLDLGHYERFTGIHTTRNNSITTGRIYKTVIDRERHGDYLGKTIQVVPHITDEIKRRMLREEEKGENLDFVITEVGGTIGDIESAPFMEAIRQLRWQLGRDAVCVHLTYVPYLKAAEELKTKPTQHSVKELQGMGIQPDILVLRTERHLDDAVRMKVASFCNVDLECVVQSEDMPSIYQVPVSMQRQGLDAAIMRKIGIPVGETPSMKSWHDFLDKQSNATREVHIGLVGKYNLQDAYKSIRESLNLAGIYNDVKVKLHFINSEDITPENVAQKLEGMAGAVICPGFGQRAIEGKIIPVEDRIGILDRKMRVVGENTVSEATWLNWTFRAFQSVYGYEFQGDNLLIARINLLLTFADYLEDRWHREPTIKELKKLANIIVWNLWQMDGITGTVPYGKPKTVMQQQNLFFDYEQGINDTEPETVDCKIHDWRDNGQ